MPRVNFAPCRVEGCPDMLFAHGRCRAHYGAARRSGEITPRPKLSEQDRFWSKVSPEPMSGCWLWAAGYFELYGNFCRANAKSEGAHRVAWEFANGRRPPSGMHVCHRCDNPACVNPAHLFLGSALDNETDKIRKGRKAYRIPVARGESTWCAKLTWVQVCEIRARSAAGETAVSLSKAFGISRSQVGNIIFRRQWTASSGSSSRSGTYPGGGHG